MRPLLRALGFWFVPITLTVLLAALGVAAGFANAQPRAVDVTTTEAPVATAERRAGFDVTVIRLGVAVPNGRVLVVQDSAGKTYRVLVSRETVLKRDGKRVGLDQLKPATRLIGLGRRDDQGVLVAIGAAIVPPAKPPV